MFIIVLIDLLSLFNFWELSICYSLEYHKYANEIMQKYF